MLSLPTFVQPVLPRRLGETRIPEGHPQSRLAVAPVQPVLTGGPRSGLRRFPRLGLAAGLRDNGLADGLPGRSVVLILAGQS